MSIRRKVGLTALLLLAVLVLLLVVVVPRMADLDRYRPQVIAHIEQGTGRSAAIGRLSLTVLPTLSVRADDIAIGNPPGFPQGHFLEIRRAYAELDASALLLHRNVVVRWLKIEDPKLSLLSDSHGRWNTEGPVRSGAVIQPAFWQSSATPASTIARIEFEHGQVTAAGTLPSGEAGPPFFEADGVSAQLEKVNPEALGLHIAWARDRGTPAGKRAPRFAVSRIALWSGPAVDPSEAESPPQPRGPLAAHGTIHADSARFGLLTITGVKSGLEIFAGGLVLKDLALQLFGGQVTGNVLWNPSTEPPRYVTHLNLADIDVARALEAFPNSRGKLTGTLDGKLDLTGQTGARGATPVADPLANLEGTGNVTIRNGTLPALQSNRDMMQLMKNIVRSGNSGDPSSFRSIAADIEIGDGAIHSRQITILGNGIELDVSGSVALAGAGKLDYQGTGKIMARQNGVGSLVAGLLGSKMSAGGKITFPFTLTGTLAAPHFVAPRSPIFH